MNGIQLLKLVKAMREVQRDYKRTGNMRLLSKLPLLEKAVDNAIEEYEAAIEKVTPKQMKMQFDDENNEL